MNTSVLTPAARLAAGGLYTQAGNFLSRLGSDVDARTGQMALFFALPDLQANNLAGPTVPVKLIFSSLSSYADFGFGCGWLTTFSEFDLPSGRLQLGTGESFSLDRDASDFTDGGLLVFRDQKLPVFRVIQEGGEGTCFRIEYKDGQTERLQVQEDSQQAVLSQIRSPQGFQVNLEWRPHGSGRAVLWEIRDEYRCLLRVARELEGEAQIQLFPDEVQKSEYTLVFSNDRLSSLTFPDGDSRLDIVYEESDQLLYPSRLASPLGGLHEITYATGENGHQLPPGAPLDFMPRVISHRHDPGADQPATTRTYAWVGTTNYWGYGAALPGGWKDNQDNLYRVGDYEYKVTETLSSETGEALSVIERTWNHFHSLIEQTTYRRGKTVRNTTRYGDIRNAPWEAQPAFCQLPIETTTRYEDSSGYREETAKTVYDDHGNMLEQHHVDGRIERWAYFLPGSEDAPDPGPFVRWLQFHCLEPAVMDSGDSAGALATQTHYRYAALPKRQPGDRVHLVPISELALAMESAGPRLIGKTEQCYEIAPESPFFSQVTRATTTLNGLETTTEYLRVLTGVELVTTATVTGHDGVALTTSDTTRDSVTGLTCREREDGSDTCFEYDAMGRVVRSIVAPGSSYEAIGTCRYVLVGRNRNQAVMAEETNHSGEQRRVYLDGMGRRVREERGEATDGNITFRQTWRGAFNSEGHLFEEVHQDFLPGQVEPLGLVTVYEVDDWGQVNKVILPDGTTEHTQACPISLVTQTWKESSEGIASARTRILRNASGDVLSLNVLACDGAPLRSEAWTHDGLHRPIAHTITVPGQPDSTTYTQYDVQGRVTRRVLEDATEVRWEYASHSDDNHPTRVSLTSPMKTSWTLGTQAYDGLGRPTQRNIAGQRVELNYKSGQKLPDSRVSGGGRKLSYGYEKSLENALAQLTPGDGSAPSTFTYHSKSGQMTEALGALGTIRREYAVDGKLQSEHWRVNNKTYSTTWLQSLLGRLDTFTDVNGTRHCTSYDAHGRPEKMTMDSIELYITYDPHGRVSQYLTVDEIKGHSLRQEIVYDDFDRELTRSWESITPTSRRLLTQTLKWTARDQMASREWTDASQLLSSEVFDYDIRGRLVEVIYAGEQTAIDPRTSKQLRRQVFTLNELDGYKQVCTTYADGNQDYMDFTYDNAVPDRPVVITHSYPVHSTQVLRYDDDGHLVSDGNGRTFGWDEEGRLKKVTQDSGQRDYQYSPVGRLGLTVSSGAEKLWFYQNDQLISTVALNSGSSLSLMRDGPSVFAQSKVAQAVRAVLLVGSDGQASVRVESDGLTQLLQYTVHGASEGSVECAIGYAGEALDVIDGGYQLGDYRPYDPSLMQFLASDEQVPFGTGGPNRYAYCGADPLNRVDGTGQSFWKWLLTGVMMAFAAVATVASFGIAAPAVGAVAAGGLAALTTSGALAVTSAALGVVSLASGVSSMILEAAGNESAASILGWVSIGTGAASVVTALAPAASKGIAKLGQFVGRWQKNLQSAGGVPKLGAQGLRSAPSASLGGLPEPAMANIIRHLPGRDLANLSATSRSMNQMVSTYSRPALHALPVSPEHSPHYVNAVRRIWAGQETGVLPSSLRRSGVHPRSITEAAPLSRQVERSGYVPLEWVQSSLRDGAYFATLDERNSWYLLERAARQQNIGRRYSF
ncbi:hypothetical protein JWR97_05235 [Pseudomonas cedrina subsp. fulgida]|nr:hypothetical protein [Pseudomonas cedrina subsp. fulgida]